jgi:hypothetical protein
MRGRFLSGVTALLARKPRLFTPDIWLAYDLHLARRLAHHAVARALELVRRHRPLLA